ncbi:LodA/GoxA family CTQ-dependent oxidase [Nannocystis bainbridge]|uniref:LodA/GoxA family CTQ-dependent oxidase n=1 Tax=Nannocystis bainbridge TaxID=2995303 RepID=A0ABT5ECF5_9BACT|nr:LodA/GoxA family CTQ-dependent oxidase [Nannocystis bainbridge]MDC0723551.1 LodA/GoxA family CTQ-dependent oxidase [Nannocystis bainbridge]
MRFAQNRALATGRDPATRPVFLRLHGVAFGRFEISPDLPEELRVGLFVPGASHRAWVRFSSDLQPGRPDLGGTLGIGIKLFDVEGPKLLEPDTEARTHDFILQNHPVFFVDDAAKMCAFTCASLNGQLDAWLADNPVTAQILKDMEKKVDSALDSPYWSVLPYSFGQRHVKYKLVPEAAGEGPPVDVADPTYLRADLHRRMAAGEARFGFYVQLKQADMPLDRATVEWSERESPPVRVGTLVLPQQDLDARGQSAYGENLAYNPWHALPAHAPAGSISDARRVVYRASADNRRDVNGQPRGEPTAPRPDTWDGGRPYPTAVDRRIVRAAIHPAIGIARVGNSEHEFLYGPEVVDAPPAPVGAWRDSTGAFKRQAARFRIYGYNAAGDVVGEITANTADITWRVHVANHKAAWYQWQMALDIPEAEALALPLRNAGVKPADRAELVIDGGPVEVRGVSTVGSTIDGEFQGTPVRLGQLRTDEVGRLVFLGGHGTSASPTNQPIYNDKIPTTFINADGWYDDTSDGPVTATVRIEGAEIPVEGAWVVTAPPDYGPGVLGVRTLHDLLVDMYVQAGWQAAPRDITFKHDVWPLLRRLTGLQWNNRGFAVAYGAGSRLDFDDRAFAAELAWRPAPDGYDRNQELRRQIANCFRPSSPTDGNQLPWPWLYGDAMESVAIDNPRQNATITRTQEQVLAKWVAGEFVDDFAAALPTYAAIEQVPLAEQPAMLDRASLEHALADAFHPGCEVTWPVRHLTMFARPFRIRQRPAGTPAPDYGPKLTQPVALGPDGPLYEQGPGDLTRWMGLPWQADTAFCRAGYDEHYDPFIPSFWPARVPNQVLTLEQYRVLMDSSQPLETRRDAFAARTDWNARLSGDAPAQMKQMVHEFQEMGLLEVQPGPSDIPGVPAQLRVATGGRPAPLKGVAEKLQPHEWPVPVHKPAR